MNNKPGHDIVDLYEAINTFKPVDEDIWFVVEARQRAEGFYAEGKRILVSNCLPLKQRGESFSKLGQIVADDRNSIWTKSTIWVRQRDEVQSFLCGLGCRQGNFVAISTTTKISGVVVRKI